MTESSKKAEKRLSEAKVRLLLEHPFFGRILCRFPPVMTEKVATACVTREGRMYVNPDFICGLKRDQVIFLLAHETMHLVLLHPFRRGKRSPRLWNIAADAVINAYLREHGIGAFIPGGVDMPKLAGKSAEFAYAALVRKEEGAGIESYRPEKDPLAEDVSEEGAGAEPVSGAELASRAAEIRRVVAQAAAEAEASGKGEGFLPRQIIPKRGDPGNWHALLERFLVKRASQAASWARPNRRYREYGFLPSLAPEPGMGEVAVGIDVSGSVEDRDLERFLSSLNEIAEQCRPAAVRVLWCSDRVWQEDEYALEDLPVEAAERPEEGRTDMRAVFGWIQDKGLEPDAVLVFTDGETPFPERTDFPTAWILTGKSPVPEGIGEVIRMQEERP